MIHTQNVGDGEEGVEGETHDEPQHQEGDVLRGEGCGHARDESEDVGGHDGGDPAVGVSQPAKEDHAGNGASEEERLRECWYPGLVTDPVLLHSDGHVIVGHVVLPPCLALHHLPVTGGQDRLASLQQL